MLLGDVSQSLQEGEPGGGEASWKATAEVQV